MEWSTSLTITLITLIFSLVVLSPLLSWIKAQCIDFYSRNLVKGPSSFVHSLHVRKKENIVRLGSNEYSIIDPKLLTTIYSDKKFLKSEQYAAFDVDGEPTIFSMRDPVEHDRRAKSVRGMFKTTEVQKHAPLLQRNVQAVIKELERGRGTERDVLAVMRGYAIRTISEYALGKPYLEHLSLTQVGTEYGLVLNDINASARFGQSQSWTMRTLEYIKHWIQRTIATPSPVPSETSAQLAEAYENFTSFTRSIADGNGENEEEAGAEMGGTPNVATYRHRLAHLGLTTKQVDAELSDLLFAGTDSLATTLGTALWHIYSTPSVLRALRASDGAPAITHPESRSPSKSCRFNLDSSDDLDGASRTTTYLNAVVDESLRITTPVPRRLPRVIPIPVHDPHSSSSSSDTKLAPSSSTTAAATAAAAAAAAAEAISTSSTLHAAILYDEDELEDGWTKVIPCGATVGVPAYSLHRAPSTFAAPERFQPERWLECSAPQREEMKARFVPFGRGVRACMGQDLARTQLRSVIRAVVDTFDGETVGSAPEFEDNFNATVVGNAIFVKFSPRSLI